MQTRQTELKFVKLIIVQVKDEDGNQHEVCSKTFLSVFCITAERVQFLAAHKWQTDNPRGEQRRGKRPKAGYENLLGRNQMAHQSLSLCFIPLW